MKTYPEALSELMTLRLALEGRSIARFGDGELRLAMGPPAKQCKTQCHHPVMQKELKRLLSGKTRSLICLPRLDKTLPTYERHWKTFEDPKWAAMITDDIYGSSFISRPDSVPAINNPEYWGMVRTLWEKRTVTLVIGEPDENGKQHSLIPEHLCTAHSVRVIRARERDAYQDIERIDFEIGPSPNGVVILCLGTTATCLAERCAQRGVQALDLGHVGKFMPK